jgi:hypothetical protein
MISPDTTEFSKYNRNFLGSGKTFDQYFYDKKKEESRLGGPMTAQPAMRTKAETSAEEKNRITNYESSVATKSIPSSRENAQLTSDFAQQFATPPIDWQMIGQRLSQLRKA